MRLLLDTHAFLLAAADPDQLNPRARGAIEDTANDIFVSAGVAWEIIVKAALGKLGLPADPALWFPARVRSLGFQPLDITTAHALAVGGLPNIHRDPFDRIMLAQAQIEGLTFVTRDSENKKYPVHVLEA
ncbi:MAG TPA: type II toxin-antitoxin system VapC family toxin [Candidatus Elarobacter sp.]|nr:type II toxin-antitoxin system VapC family toxin [Candidatus Elarobacter sp.]